jgi:hypothetical protein
MRLIQAAALSFLVLKNPALAQSVDWPAEKCRRYSHAWHDALIHPGAKGLGKDFLSAHSAFISAGCAGPREVCPRSPEELEMANTMTMLALNAGMSGTFLPFARRTRS